MSKKDFKRGVEAAAKANEAFMRKQAVAVEELGKRIVQKIDEQGKIIDVVLDKLNAQEKKELYNLQSAYDIAELGKNEKDNLYTAVRNAHDFTGSGTGHELKRRQHHRRIPVLKKRGGQQNQNFKGS